MNSPFLWCAEIKRRIGLRYIGGFLFSLSPSPPTPWLPHIFFFSAFYLRGSASLGLDGEVKIIVQEWSGEKNRKKRLVDGGGGGGIWEIKPFSWRRAGSGCTQQPG
jgi:hypothetical protein